MKFEIFDIPSATMIFASDDEEETVVGVLSMDQNDMWDNELMLGIDHGINRKHLIGDDAVRWAENIAKEKGYGIL